MKSIYIDTSKHPLMMSRALTRINQRELEEQKRLWVKRARRRKFRLLLSHIGIHLPANRYNAPQNKHHD